MKATVYLFLLFGFIFSTLEVKAKYYNHTTNPYENSLEHLNAKNKFEQCGIDSAYICLRYFGKNVSLEDLTRKVPPEVFQRGMSIEELQQLLNLYSLDSMVISGKPEVADHWLEQGYILILPKNTIKHFYVYLSSRENEYFRYNPPYLSGWVSRDSLLNDWEGNAVVVSNKDIKRSLGYSNSIASFFTIIGTTLATGSIGLLFWGFWVRNPFSRKR